MSNRNAVIIKKVKKVTAAGHHGGAWKVAYADFVTAMMAFFLLLWLLSMVSDEKRARVSEYYKTFSLYSETGSSFISGAENDIFSKSGGGSEKVLAEMDGEADEVNDVQQKLTSAIANNLGDLEEQVSIEKVKDGIRIHLTDNEGSTMFERGSNKMTAKAKEVLKVIGANIKSLKNKVSIEGHTDALPFAGKQYSNWELSTERASSARRELEANGLDPKRLTSVAGFADTDPLIEDDPNDARNRRISIILKFPKKKQKKQLLTKKPNDPKKKVSEELLNIIDKSAVTARGTNDNDAINIIVNAPEENNTQNADAPAESAEMETKNDQLKNRFKPVFDKEDLKTNIGIPESMSRKDQIGKASEKDTFSPVFGKEGWNPSIALPESGLEEDQVDSALQIEDAAPEIEQSRNVSEELLNIIDKATITARGNNDRDAMNRKTDTSYQPSSPPAAPTEEETDNDPSGNEFKPVMDKSGWKPIF